VSRFVELSHVLEPGMPVYPGFPEPDFTPILTHEQSRERYRDRSEFLLGRANMPTNTGTYLDVPFHRYRDGDDLSRVALEMVAGLPGFVVDADSADGRALALDVNAGDLRGRAVLVRTGWSERWGTDGYWEPGPFLSASALDVLIDGRAALVGVDFWNVDDTEDLARPAHTRLLAERILIVEHMTNLRALPRDGFRFFAVPPRLVGGAGFPVRAFAEVP
jgi:arylformamidase